MIFIIDALCKSKYDRDRSSQCFLFLWILNPYYYITSILMHFTANTLLYVITRAAWSTASLHVRRTLNNTFTDWFSPVGAEASTEFYGTVLHWFTNFSKSFKLVRRLLPPSQIAHFSLLTTWSKKQNLFLKQNTRGSRAPSETVGWLKMRSNHHSGPSQEKFLDVLLLMQVWLQVWVCVPAAQEILGCSERI